MRRVHGHRPCRRRLARHDGRGRPARSIARALAIGALAASGWILGASISAAPERYATEADPRPQTDAPGPVAHDGPALGGWRGVLTDLAQRRSSAWRRAHPGDLDRVFLSGSSVLRRDRHALRSYLDRRLRPDGATIRFGSIQQLSRTQASAALVVEDWLAPSSVTGRDGESRALPRDRPSRHEVVLRRTPQGWRIAAIHHVDG